MTLWLFTNNENWLCVYTSLVFDTLQWEKEKQPLTSRSWPGTHRYWYPPTEHKQFHSTVTSDKVTLGPWWISPLTVNMNDGRYFLYLPTTSSPPSLQIRSVEITNNRIALKHPIQTKLPSFWTFSEITQPTHVQILLTPSYWNTPQFPMPCILPHSNEKKAHLIQLYVCY